MSVAFVREESAAAAQEVSLPPRAISAHPNLVTQSGLRALARALATPKAKSVMTTKRPREHGARRRRQGRLIRKAALASKNGLGVLPREGA
jgi:hypothetical protein